MIDCTILYTTIARIDILILLLSYLIDCDKYKYLIRVCRN